MKELPVRKNTRLKDYDYTAPGVYYVTICTRNRTNFFWNGELDKVLFGWKCSENNIVRPANLPLSECGEIVQKELEIWNKTYENVFLQA